MAIYSVNQNRQFYVLKKKVEEEKALKNPGDYKMGEDKDGKIFFKHVGQGGLTRTDFIDPDKVCYAKYTPKNEMERKPKKAVIKLNDVNGGQPISGQDYILRVQINNFFSPGDASVYIKSCAVHAFKEMTPAQFYKALYKSLVNNFEREDMKLLTFKLDGDEANPTGVIIKEDTNQPWRLGILSQTPVNFEVTATTVRYDGEDVIWAVLDEKTGRIKVKEDTEAGPIPNSKEVADIEYFCSAERGDMFRNMGYPLNIDVKMMVDPEDKEGYDMLDLHYYFSDEGVQVHKSEKDITFVSTDTEIITGLKKALEEKGIKVNKIENKAEVLEAEK